MKLKLEENSKVACGQLGFTKHINFDYDAYLRGEPRFRRLQFGLRDVRCSGVENSLMWCKNKLINDHYSHCKSRKPVILQCAPGRHFQDQIALKEQKVDALFSHSRQPENLFLRLKSGGNLGEGRVEIMVDARFAHIANNFRQKQFFD